MFKKWLTLLLSTSLMLSACYNSSPVYNQTEGNVADMKLKAAAARHKSDESFKTPPSLLVNQGLYVDTTPINLEKRPSWLENRVVIRGDSLPFSYYARTISAGAGNNVLVKYQTGLDPSVNVSLSYTGSIKGALDLLAAKSGYVYNVRGNSILWQAFVTKTFDIAFMPGGTDYLMGKSSDSSSSSTPGGSTSSSSTSTSNYVSSDSSDDEYSSLKGSLSIWKDLDSTIKQMLSPEGKVMVSESTTSVTVRDRPSNVELVGKYIYNLNNNLSKQVLVKIQVLDVSLNTGYDFGIDWNIVTKSFHNSKFVLNGNNGTPITLTPLGGTSVNSLGTDTINTGVIPGYTILFRALSQQGKTSIVSEPRVVCLNNQVSVVRVVTSEGYVASVQNTTLSGGSGSTVSNNTVTSQVTPGTLITGLTLYILPKILHDKIYMQVNADLSTKDALTTFGSAGSQVQLPTISIKHFNQRSMIHSGDTLILSGFRQLSNKANANQFMNSQALGGKGAEQQNKETIVLITPIILNGSNA